jgi:uncharacterized protein (TIGR02611 family)
MPANFVSRFKRQWQELAASAAGRRFQDRYHRRREKSQSPLMRMITGVAGLVLLVAGVLMLFVPGPGALTMLVGAALLAERSLVAARVLDWLELKSRDLARWARQAWRKAAQR